MLGTFSRRILVARPLAALCAVLVAASLVATSFAAAPAAPAGPSGLTSVIIRGEAGLLVQLEHSTVLAGGTIVRELGLIDGFSARIPSAKLAAIRALPGVLAVSPDSGATFHSTYDPGSDPYSMINTAAAVGATAAWKQGITGAGVDVAVIDSGVTPVVGLAGPGKVVNGPDLSFDSQTPSVQYLDGFGHGTFMAGLIAARDPGADVNHPGSAYLGIAPDARIVNVKVGAANGAVDVSQVIAGIDWVVQHRHDNGLNIRVLSLSLGTHSSQDWRVDPLAFAADVAWRYGIVVVVAAGNDGAAAGRLDDPAIDPNLIAVGAAGTQADYSKSVAALFSSLGDGQRNPDLLAPGIHLQGLRVPGSFIDQRYSSAAFGDRYFRGSGTSEATAITAGVVALLLQRQPDLRPAQVKAILKAGLVNQQGENGTGPGLLHAVAAVAGELNLSDLLGVWQHLSYATGTGSLELARGDVHVAIGGVTLSGEQDIFGNAFSGARLAWPTAAGRSWNGGTWNGGSWTGTTWSGTTWSGTTWSGTTWSGTTWSGTTWSGTTWSGTTWTGTTWSGTTWSGTTWSGTTWSGDIWSMDSWS
ncbi:MAG: S8 family serine peptidase [Candidatus Dormibacteraeota bacterium]|nr:S8 family serine peptidase [Candidatus Dormibacteraeota bacterium]